MISHVSRSSVFQTLLGRQRQMLVAGLRGRWDFFKKTALDRQHNTRMACIIATTARNLPRLNHALKSVRMLARTCTVTRGGRGA
jgi:CRISPR/Cas system Type II protein with McrA/HNH and RuvC-like nuclease domain